ncbi:uncharacterized protein LOC113330501 [Papaver somniferum]|uniref:uncharacterized protein LOC113330501 n=1 Tax=Papaver somniferum TaxID=3469 RepID=UPI000E6F8203|nr:uncharacterized protein LOC113330501 [Papaver somniferum]
MFLKAVNFQGEYKDKVFIANFLKETINEVGADNVVQVITDNAPVCKSAGLLIETHFPHIFWTPCVVHTLNLALKNICAAKNTEANDETFAECSWISDIISDAVFVRKFIMTHSMRLEMFNDHNKLKLLTVAYTRFASSVIMLQRFVDIKEGLQSMVISPKWTSYIDDDVGKAQFLKETTLNDQWWDKVDYIIAFTESIYDMLRRTDTDRPCLHLVYDMWESMIEKVRKVIYRKEGLTEFQDSSFYYVVYEILTSRWGKSNTPLHCLAHSLNPRYYSQEWLSESSGRLAPHVDDDMSKKRRICFERYFEGEELRKVNTEFALFSAGMREFATANCIVDRWCMESFIWWVTYGTPTPIWQRLAFRTLAQPSFSYCCERNWSTFGFINSLKRNKITPKRGEDLVYVHSNLRLLSRREPHYMTGETRMWDVAGDTFDTMGSGGILEIANLSLDEPELESVTFNDPAVPVDEDVNLDDN